MTKESQANEPGQTREIIKRDYLEYLYQTPPALTIYPLLGSLVRALGKEWVVDVFPSRASIETFRNLRSKLKDPSQLLIERSTHLTRGIPRADLVLVENLSRRGKVKYIRDAFIGFSHIMVSGYNKDQADYNLISRFSQKELNLQGVTVFTGPGKGKSTSAFGIGAKAVANGEKAAVVQWFKEPKGTRGTWSINEHYFPDQLQDPSLLEFYPTGVGFYGSPNWDRITGEEAYQQHKLKAENGVDLARQLIASRRYNVIVLDELVDTLAEVSQNIPRSLLDLNTVRALLSLTRQYPEVQVVVTGRRVTQEWSDLVKSSIAVDEIRHPWSQRGKPAVSGLDF